MGPIRGDPLAVVVCERLVSAAAVRGPDVDVGLVLAVGLERNPRAPIFGKPDGKEN